MSVKSGAKKTLAVFMSLLMGLSCLVFAPISFEAKALPEAGKYTVKINYTINKSTGSAKQDYKGKQSFFTEIGNDNNETSKALAGFSIFYKTENGTGDTYEAWWDIGRKTTAAGSTLSSDTVKAPTISINGGNGNTGTATATLSGFPTEFFVASKNSATGTNSGGEFTITSIEVNGKTIWAGAYYLASKNRRYYGTLTSDGEGTCEGYADQLVTHINYKANPGYETGWSLPAATSIIWQTDDDNWIKDGDNYDLKDITIDETDNISRTAKFTVQDQYGTNMSTAALDNLSTPVDISILATNYPSLNGSSYVNSNTADNLYFEYDNDNGSPFTATVTAKPELKSDVEGLNERLVTVTATVGTDHLESTKTFTIYDPMYTVSFNPNGGSINPTSAQVYYGESLNSQKTLDGSEDNYYPEYGIRAGYSFLGIYDAKSGGNLLNPDSTVKSDQNYYAHWDKNTYAVVFLDREGKYLDIQYVPYGEDADTTEIEKQLNKIEYDEGDDDGHWVLNSDIWSPSVKSVGGNMITSAQYTKVNHNFGDSEKVSANCQHGNATKQTCSECGYEKITEDDGKLGAHDPAEELTVLTSPTCLKEGKGTHICKVCGDPTDNVVIPAEGHSFKHEVTKEASCTETGVMTYTCTKCKTVETETIAKTQHSYVEGTKYQATCQSSGYTEMVCSACGDNYKAYDGTSSTDHSWEYEASEPSHGKITVTGVCTVCGATFEKQVESTHEFSNVTTSDYVAPTCKNDGSIKLNCGVDGCTENHTITLPKTDKHQYTTTVTDADCKNSGSVVNTCSECGDIQNVKTLSALGHSWDEGVVKAEAKCMEKGERLYTCVRCKDTKTVDIPATGHKNVEVKATCTSDGYKECGVCHTQTDIDRAEGHTYGNWTYIVNASCYTKGVKTHFCSVCGNTEIAIDENFGDHKWATGKITDYDSTCSTVGQKSIHCTVCGQIKADTKEEIAKKQHEMGEPETVLDATCDGQGVTKTVCKNCDYTETAKTPALGHAYGKTSETKATCTTDGELVETCSKCHDVKTTVLPKTGHNYVAGTPVAATCKSSGYIPYTCSGCGDTYNVISGTTAEHSWKVTSTVDHDKTVITSKCSECGEEVTHTVNGTHKFTSGTVTTPATCTTDGIVTVNCEVEGCGKSYTINIGTGGHTVATQVTEPKCETAGKAVSYCTTCNTEISSKDINAKGHSYKAEITKSATCTEKGIIKYTCSSCGDTYTEDIEIDANAHTFTKVGETVKATCTSPAYDEYKCVCGKTYKEYTGTASGHSYVTTQSQTGTTLKITCECSVCHDKHEYTTSVAEGHNYSVVSVTKYPTCHTKGEVKISCDKVHDSNCNSSVTVELDINANAHNFNTTYNYPTCENEGSVVTTCVNGCGYKSTAKLSKLSHEWGKGSVTTGATCTTDGVMTFTCTRKDCGETRTEVIAKTGHSFVAGKTHEATCVDAGYIEYSCENDGCTVSYNEYTSRALGHDWNDGETLVAGSCETIGVTRYTCKRCGDKKDVADGEEATHDYQYKCVVAPTCTEEGYDKWECSKCGDIDKRNTVPALEHDWGDWKITKYPTETENGSQERFCQRENCGAREEQTIIYGKFYLVTFYNYDGTRLMPPAYYEYGATAIRPKKTPIKVADTAYTYEFIGYNYSDAKINYVSERMAIIAQYAAHEKYYNVTYKNEDGSVLAKVNNVAFSQVAAAYPNPTPTKASDSAYDYTFGSWSINCDINSGEAVATATYKATPRKYEPPEDTGSSSDENLFTRIINWIKNLFNKLFGRG